ncbi:hypothetical protein MBLNU459_g3737t1 [Dothideomycetes sp. NU459]
MAHQMSPPQRPVQPPPPPRPYSPYQNVQSPGGIALPPAKRARLSPNPSSPQTAAYASPELNYHTYSPMNATSPPPFNVPQPYASSPVMGSMGPPPRPNPEKPEKEEKEKIHDISDVTDVFHGSGIDLREEENYMTNTFRNVHGSASFNNSFGSSTTTPSPNNSFSQLNQGSFGSTQAFSGSGPISQPPASQESVEEELTRKHKLAARELAEKQQQHLRDPFLQSNIIRHRMHKIAYDQGVALNVEGLFDKIPERPQNVHGVTATGPNGTAAASLKAHGLLQETAPLADILALVSLAANERARALLDDAYAVARGRRCCSHGLVPPDLSDVAVGENAKTTYAASTSLTGTAWDRPAKRDSNGEIKPEPVSQGTPASEDPTVSFSSAITGHLRDLAIRDRDAERERVRKRQERARRALSANDPDAMNTPMPDVLPTSAAGTPSAAATPVPLDAGSQIAPEKPMTKKERERQAKLGQTEEVLHKNANTTAAMQLGFGRKGKKYSWMTGGQGAAPVNPYKPTTKPTTAPSAAVNGNGAGKSPGGVPEQGIDKALQARERKWGGWREDGIEGRGIQVRDWVVVLERDGREKKALQKCLLRLDST